MHFRLKLSSPSPGYRQVPQLPRVYPDFLYYFALFPPFSNHNLFLAWVREIRRWKNVWTDFRPTGGKDSSYLYVDSAVNHGHLIASIPIEHRAARAKNILMNEKWYLVHATVLWVYAWRQVILRCFLRIQSLITFKSCILVFVLLFSFLKCHHWRK